MRLIEQKKAHRVSGAAITVLGCLFAVAAPLMGQPSWAATLQSGSGGRYFHYVNDDNPAIADNQLLSSHSPFAYVATAQGASTDDTTECKYPSGDPAGAGSLTGGSGNAPWWWDSEHNDASGDWTDDYRFADPGIGMRTQLLSATKGIWFEGRLGGYPTMSGGSSFIQSVFYHEAPCWAGYSEYGFYRDSANPNRLYFYFSINTNCGLGPTFCRQNQEGGSPVYSNSATLGQPPPMNRQHTRQWDISDLGTHDLKLYAYIFYDSGAGIYKFKVYVEDVTDSSHVYANEDVVDTTLNTDSSHTSWFPINWLWAHDGYITVTQNWSDPSDCGGGGSLCISNTSNFKVTASAVKYAY